MITKVLSISKTDAISRAGNVLSAGGLVVFPTDTVYGVAASVFHSEGIARLFEAKARSTNKAIAVLIADIEQLKDLTTGLTPSAETLARRFWPGALTLVVPKHPALPANLSPLPTVGIRMPDHNFARALIRAAGPLATSSANLSGEGNTLNADQAFEQLAGRVELILDGGTVLGGVPSTVIDCTQTPPRILRQGSISAEDLAGTLAKCFGSEGS